MNVAVVGAASGIGLALTQKFIEQGSNVYAFCRTPSEALSKLNCKKIINDFDITDSSKINKAVTTLPEISFDVFFHVAGLMFYNQPHNLDSEKIMQQFNVNSLGPIQVLHAFLPSFKEGTKVGIISSRMGSIADNTRSGHIGFRMSKAALNMAGKSLSIEWRDKGIGVFLLHPGFVRTRITNFEGNMEPIESAEKLIELINKLSIKQTGTFWHANGNQLPW